MSQVLKRLCNHYDGGQISELVLSIESRQATHKIAEGEPRSDIQELAENLRIDENECEGLRPNIILFDDVVTTGAHFKACKQVIMERFPDKKVVGLFLARTVRI